MFTVIIPIFAMAAMQSQPQQIEVSTLPQVKGPTRPPNYSDPASHAYAYVSGDASIRRHSRRAGELPAVALPESDIVFNDEIKNIAGWQFYQVVVPAGKTVKAKLSSKNEDWFIVRIVNHYGHPERGMIHNVLNKYDPEASYINKGKKTNTVYFVVDTNEVNMLHEKYTLQITWN
jgi:hypothetical protein